LRVGLSTIVERAPADPFGVVKQARAPAGMLSG
jgi:hypothetical protein